MTDVPADSQVEYGTTANYGQGSKLDSSLVTSHSVTVSGLSASTLYHCRVKSKNVSGSFAMSGDFTLTVTAPQGGTSLSVLASSMQPGTWAQLQTNNIGPVLGQGDFSLNVLPYADRGAWYAVGKRFWFVGGDHTGQPFSPSRQVYYDEATNTWVDLGLTNFGGAHAYDHLAINQAARQLYFFPFNAAKIEPWQYDLATGGPWTLPNSFAASGYLGITHGVDWFDGPLAGAGSQGALAMYICGNAGGELALYDPLSKKLVAHITGFGGNGTYHCFLRYGKVRNVAIFGGGNANELKIWRLNANRTITAMPDAPIPLGIQRGNVVNDPVTGDFLVRGHGHFYKYDPRGTGTWTQLADPPPNTVGDPSDPVRDGVISAPISNYGVIMYVTCSNGKRNCRVDLYKHATRDVISSL
jgi:hypothetical protein